MEHTTMKRLFLHCAIVFGTTTCTAQFNTVQRTVAPLYEVVPQTAPEQNPGLKETLPEAVKPETVSPAKFREARGLLPRNVSSVTKGKKKTTATARPRQPLAPDLTVMNLMDEMERLGIKHRKIVLAQAILETGWFTSHVCRNLNNLFGLTNPRTGRYYEFSDWKESVKAYRDKVQYRYKGGNYLLWLRDIGYAEDPRYVSSLVKVLRTHIL